jgi:hypothetical protein
VDSRHLATTSTPRGALVPLISASGRLAAATDGPVSGPALSRPCETPKSIPATSRQRHQVSPGSGEGGPCCSRGRPASIYGSGRRIRHRFCDGRRSPTADGQQASTTRVRNQRRTTTPVPGLCDRQRHGPPARLRPVSTTDQQPHLQVDARTAAGCYRVFVATASGAAAGRPVLEQILDQLRTATPRLPARSPQHHRRSCLAAPRDCLAPAFRAGLGRTSLGRKDLRGGLWRRPPRCRAGLPAARATPAEQERQNRVLT